MGLTVHVETLRGVSHPAWDDGKFGGDRELPAKLARVSTDNRFINDDWLIRPIDFVRLREVLSEYDVNEERWATLADILEAEPQYWIRFCA